MILWELKKVRLLFQNPDLKTTAEELLTELLDEDSEILTIIKGEEAIEEQVDVIVNFVEEKYPDCEIEIHEGKQPLYNYIFSVE